MESQCARILAYLQSGKTLTTYQAFTQFRCTRLPSRINELRNAGYEIESPLVKRGRARVAAYRLVTK